MSSRKLCLSKNQLLTTYIIITIVVYILPYLKYSTPYMIAAPMMLVSLLMINTHHQQVPRYILVLVYLAVLLGVNNMLFGQYSFVESVNETIRHIRFFIPLIWGVYAITLCNVRQRKWILICFGIVAAYILMNTITALQEDQWITRLLAQGAESSSAALNAYRLKNVGGFEFSYMIGVVTLCFVWLATKTRKVSLKIGCVIIIVFLYYYIIQTMYTTLLLLTFLGTIILIFRAVDNNFIKVALVISSIALIFGIVPLLNMLSSLFENNLLSIKFQQISAAIVTRNSGELGSRPDLILQSLQNWSTKPIFGGQFQNSNSHSLVFGILERNGLVGITLVGYLFYKAWRLLKNVLNVYGMPDELFDISVLYMLCLSVFNPIGYIFEIPIAVYCIVPIFIAVFYSVGGEQG